MYEESDIVLTSNRTVKVIFTQLTKYKNLGTQLGTHGLAHTHKSSFAESLAWR
jgi:hypothetical protein